MMTLDKNLKETGFVNITDNYFDFHRSLFNPSLSEFDAFNKVHDDKLMEMHYQKKIHEFMAQHSKTASPDDHTKGGNTEPRRHRETFAESTQAETATAPNRAGITPLQLDLFKAAKIQQTEEPNEEKDRQMKESSPSAPPLKLLKA